MMKELAVKLQKIDDYFQNADPSFSEREKILSRTVKLNEEVGELCEATLTELDGCQRVKDKVIDLDSELADIIICTLLLARNRDKDVWEEVHKKLDQQLEHLNLN